MHQWIRKDILFSRITMLAKICISVVWTDTSCAYMHVRTSVSSYHLEFYILHCTCKHLNAINSTWNTLICRIETILNSDKILVMASGEVKEYGSPAELCRNPHSLFTALYEEHTRRWWICIMKMYFLILEDFYEGISVMVWGRMGLLS